MTNVKAYLRTLPHSLFGSIALLLLRLIVGIAFLYHGFGKIQNPFGWMSADSSVPGFFQFLAAVSEFGGGLALILGLLTSIAMLGLACTMAVAVYMHAIVRNDPFVAHGASFELPAVYFCVAILFIAMGPGKFSADYKIFGTR